MSENKMNENDDDDEELIAVEDDEEQGQHPEPEDDDDDDGDKRLAESEDDPDGDTSLNRKKRTKRRQVQRMAKEAAQAELRILREQNHDLIRRLTAVESNTLSQNESALEQKLAETEREIQQAELIIARAIEAGNGDDVAMAMRLRDDAKARSMQFEAAKFQVSNVREQHYRAASAPAVNPAAASLAQQWMAANPWYDSSGRDENSALANMLDSQLTREGYNPTDVGYYKELTKRLNRRFGNSEDTSTRDQDDEDDRPRRKAPPMGSTREHAPLNTKKEVYVTPERKQAMIDAGIWDDPSRRNQMLKAYQAYDRNSAR
jgi:uncharacterized protein YheU (UPF0270 family)